MSPSTPTHKNFYCISSICIKKWYINRQLSAYFDHQFVCLWLVGWFLVHQLVAAHTESRKNPEITWIQHFYKHKYSKIKIKAALAHHFLKKISLRNIINLFWPNFILKTWGYIT